MGQHLRVVGNLPGLGSWAPEQGLILRTTASDFPFWQPGNSATDGSACDSEPSPTQSFLVDEQEHIEYKFIICDNSISDSNCKGAKVVWEEGENRKMRFHDLFEQGVIPRAKRVLVQEAFRPENPNDPNPKPPKFVVDTSSLVHKKGVTCENSNSISPSTTSTAAHTPSDIISDANALPLARKRSSSRSLLPNVDSMESCDDDPTAILRSRSETKSYSLLPSADESPTVSPVAVPVFHGLLREESCSILFFDVDEETTQPQEFADRYTLLDKLGEGSFGLVWQCVQKDGVIVPGMHKDRAAKIVRKANLHARDLGYLLGEDGEVQTHMTMKHPNIVELFEYFDEPQMVVLVLERCLGGDLFDAIVTQRKQNISKRGLLEHQAAVVTQHVLRALEYMHNQSVVHRDIKCENVLLAKAVLPLEQNFFKLCDFGFAARDRGRGLTDRLGTPDTVAPEVIDAREGSPYSCPVDIWSLGVLLYMMLAASPPFSGCNDREVLRKAKAGNFSLAGPIWEQVKDEPKGLIPTLICVDAKKRPTATQVLSCDWLRSSLPVEGA